MEPLEADSFNFEPMNFPLEKQTDDIKNKLHAAISNNDSNKFKELMKQFNVDPHEELSVKEHNWTGIHYAAHFKAPQILEYLLILTYTKYPKDYIRILNMKTKEGWTCLMIASIYKSLECLKLLYQYGGLQTQLTDCQDKTALKLAEFYGATECYEYISKQPKSNIPLNKDMFALKLKIETNPQYTELLTYGIRLPCLFCNSNMGYLRYCRWCGCPVHKICLKENDSICKGCKKSGGEITGEIIFPEKAFVLE